MDTPALVRKADRDTLLKEFIMAIIHADTIPDLMFGSRMWKKVYRFPAPKILAASSMEKSKFARLEVTTRMT